MAEYQKKVSRHIGWLVLAAIFVVLTVSPGVTAEYDNALKGVKGYDAIFEVSQGNPKVANIVFWAIRNAYQVDEVKALKGDPKIAIVFHGPAVKLISSDKSHFNGAEWAEVEKFQKMLKEMKKDGVTMEVCLYAAEVMGVDKKTIIPEIDHVGNGFVSVIGYQMQGYAVVRVP
ncbi:MAG: hypothetical protein C0615_09200 [Desulfuromonas sp.]|nr:MAG: hypothetical protein C0615_09200 [Desulfuromonas sp.]